MQTTVRMRLTAPMKAGLKAMAAAKKGSISKEVRNAMRPYLEGEKVLEKAPLDEMKDTTFVCTTKDLAKFKALVEQSGLSFDYALRKAIEDYLHNAVHSTTPVKSDNI